LEDSKGRLLGVSLREAGDVVVVEFVVWKPRRSSAKDRRPTWHVLGITNFDGERYHAIMEVDEKDNGVLKKIMKLDPLMIVETEKGYHVYLPFTSTNPLKVIHYLYKTKVADKGHLSLARKRNEEELKYKLILRISPKYDKPDMKILYYRDGDEWVGKIRKLIETLHS